MALLALAAHMHEADADAMLARIGWRKFVEWRAYQQLQPLGEERMDWRMASVCAVIANANRGKNKSAYAVKDFLLNFTGGQQRKQTWQEQKAALFRALGYHEALLKEDAARRRLRERRQQQQQQRPQPQRPQRRRPGAA